MLLVVEEQVRGVDGVKEVRSVAAEGVASVSVELLLGRDGDRVLSDVKSAVDRITSFPADVERPVISLVTMRRQVITLVVYGDAPERSLRRVAEGVRDDILQSPRITTVEMAGARPLEIAVEVPQENLRRYGLSLGGIAEAIRGASIDLPAGALKTDRGEVLLRTTERREWGREFAELPLISRADGTQVTIGDVAAVQDGFSDVDLEMTFDGKRAQLVDIYRVGDQTPTEIADIVKRYVGEQQGALPAGISMATWNDQSEFLRGRIDLLVRNAALGLVLVMVVLGLFLELKLAFWVTLGIPISFIGAFLLLPIFGSVSINMVSLFAFIVTLGMVVDDAIVVASRRTIIALTATAR